MLQIITGLQILIRANHTTSKVVMAPWLNWIEQPPPKGQVTGSNPVGVTRNFPMTCDRIRCAMMFALLEISNCLRIENTLCWGKRHSRVVNIFST